MAERYDIEAVRRKYIGIEIAKSRGRYPVEYDPIRPHCASSARKSVMPMPPPSTSQVPAPPHWASSRRKSEIPTEPSPG